MCPSGGGECSPFSISSSSYSWGRPTSYNIQWGLRTSCSTPSTSSQPGRRWYLSFCLSFYVMALPQLLLPKSKRGKFSSLFFFFCKASLQWPSCPGGVAIVARHLRLVLSHLGSALALPLAPATLALSFCLLFNRVSHCCWCPIRQCQNVHEEWKCMSCFSRCSTHFSLPVCLLVMIPPPPPYPPPHAPPLPPSASSFRHRLPARLEHLGKTAPRGQTLQCIVAASPLTLMHWHAHYGHSQKISPAIIRFGDPGSAPSTPSRWLWSLRRLRGPSTTPCGWWDHGSAPLPGQRYVSTRYMHN